MSPTTLFTLADSVDVWDCEFRWRDARGLRDLTIDDTWRRVATAAGAVEGQQLQAWTQRFVDAFRRWRLLPDARILRTLGTPSPTALPIHPGAVLNVAAFVTRQPVFGPRFDREAFVGTAALAVRLLDDVSRCVGADPCPRQLRIGVIGLADGLQALGLGYARAEGRHQATLIARALAEGCLLGSVELAEERGCTLTTAERSARTDRMRLDAMPDALIGRVMRGGLRHTALTAIDRHPSLARLANGVVDAIGPGRWFNASSGDETPDRHRVAEREMRASIQPWIDEPIAG